MGRHYVSLDKKFEVHLFNSDSEIVLVDEENTEGLTHPNLYI
jgi:hypothetical protein